MIFSHVPRTTLFLLFLQSLHSAETWNQNVTMYGSCNFAEPSFPFKNEMFVSALIPATTAKLDILFCNVWFNFSEGILRLWLQKTSFSSQTYLISTVLDGRGSLVLPGFVSAAEENVAYPFHICPPLDQPKTRNYSIYVAAPPNTGINLTVQVDEYILREGQTKSLEFGYKVSSRLLVFDVSSITGIHDHFLVTVRSDDHQQECLLIVSKHCSDAGSIDPQAASVQGTARALRLSFTTFGRVTLSHASSPQLSTGRWFIGVFLKQPQTSRDASLGKIVRVSVGFAGGVHRISIGAPVAYLVLISLFGGLVVAVFADFFLNPEYENRLLQNFRRYINTRIFTGANATDRVDAGGYETDDGFAGTETLAVEVHRLEHVLSTPSICINQGGTVPSSTSAQSYNVARLNVPRHWPGFKTWGEVIYHWFYDEVKTFAYMTAIVAFSLLIGAAQFIISNWKDMIESGNRDICYYNEGCYRATTKVDMPYNLIMSNLSYIIHGVILALSVSLREATHRVNQVAAGRKKSFSIPYAFSWALVFEGIFSSFYHLCPSRMTFQFDSAFMFVISGLVVVAVFNSVAEKTTRQADSECSVAPIRDTKLFLFFVVPLLLLNYLGSVRDTNGFLLFPDVTFYCLAILWIAIMFFWAFYRLMLPWKPTSSPDFWCKIVWLCVLFPVMSLVIGLYTIELRNDWSIFFLFTCLMCVMCAVMGYCLARFSKNIYIRAKRRRDLTAEERKELQWKMYFKWPLVNFHVVVYMVCVALCWAFALHYFLREPVTNKVKLPSKSREFNKECVLWEFFDYHDLWHILSSFALLLTAYLLIWSIG